jgi:hypothetical protein
MFILSEELYNPHGSDGTSTTFSTLVVPSDFITHTVQMERSSVDIEIEFYYYFITHTVQMEQ